MVNRSWTLFLIRGVQLSWMKIGTIGLVLLAAILLAGCASTPLTEQQRYVKLQDSWKYRAYKNTSKALLGPTLKVYNFQRAQAGSSTVDDSFAHALVGFSWSLAMQPTLALAEAELADHKADEVREHYLAHTTRSIAFYQKEWKQLAASESRSAKELLALNNAEDKYRSRQSLAHLIIGSLAVMEGDAGQARLHFEQVELSAEKPWLPTLAQATAYVYSNKWSESARLLKSVVSRGDLPATDKAFIADIAKAVDKQDVNVKQQVADFIRRQIADEFEREGDTLWATIEAFKSSIKL